MILGGKVQPEYPEKNSYYDSNSIISSFQLDYDRSCSLSIKQFSHYRLIFAVESIVCLMKDKSSLEFHKISPEGTEVFHVSFPDFILMPPYQAFRMSNGKTISFVQKVSTNDNFIIIIDDELGVVSYSKAGESPWHSQNSICESDGVIMFAEYPINAHNQTSFSNAAIYRSLNFGQTWERVFEVQFPTIRHWHTLKQDPFEPENWIATSGDEPDQCKWFLSKDNGDSWDEVTDTEYINNNNPQKSKSIHRTTTFEFDSKHYFYATDDLMGAVPQFFKWKGDERGTSSKFVKATKTSPIRLEVLADMGLHIRSMIQVDEGFIMISEAKYVSTNSQVFYYSTRLGKLFFLLSIPSESPNSGTASINSEIDKQGNFYTYVSKGSFLNSKSQTLLWNFQLMNKSSGLEYDTTNYVVFEEHLWFIDNTDRIEDIIFSSNKLRISLNENNDAPVYLILGGHNTGLPPHNQAILDIRDLKNFSIGTHVEKRDNVTLRLFISQFLGSKMTYSKSFELKEGDNSIEIENFGRADSLLLSIRLASSSYHLECDSKVVMSDLKFSSSI